MVDLTGFVKKGKNIELEEDELYDVHKETSLRRVPLWLMPREEGDRKKKEFKVTSR